MSENDFARKVKAVARVALAVEIDLLQPWDGQETLEAFHRRAVAVTRSGDFPGETMLDTIQREARKEL